MSRTRIHQVPPAADSDDVALAQWAAGYEASIGIQHDLVLVGLIVGLAVLLRGAFVRLVGLGRSATGAPTRGRRRRSSRSSR